MTNDWKDRLGVVYSTNSSFKYDTDNRKKPDTLPKEKQNLRVYIDKKKRKGKTVTLIDGFVGTDDDLKDLGKLLKTKCGVGGSAKEDQIMIQGDFKDKISIILTSEGYKVK